MVSGSDQHGTPITVRADNEGRTPQEVVDQFHPEFLRYWEELGISFDLFTTTGTKNHEDVVARHLHRRCSRRATSTRATTQQFFDPQAGALPARPLRRGHLPELRLREGARRPVRQLRPHARPRRSSSTRAASSPARRRRCARPSTSSSSSAPSRQPLLEWLQVARGLAQARAELQHRLGRGRPARPRDHARPRVGRADPGRGPRPRQAHLRLVRGVHRLPLRREGVGARRRATRRPGGAGGRTRRRETYYFIGKDNIFFHTIFWPAVLMGYGGLNLPTTCPRTSSSPSRARRRRRARASATSVLSYLERYQPDTIRYGLAANLPGDVRHRHDRGRADPPQQRRARRDLGQPREPRADDDAARTSTASCPTPGALDARDERILARARAMLDEVARAHRGGAPEGGARQRRCRARRRRTRT